MDMGRLGGSLTSSVWFMDSDLVLFRSQRFVFWLVEAFGKSLQAFLASRMVWPKLVRSFIAHAQALARCHANARSRAPVASRGKQGATFVCKVLLCRPTYQWPIACALNHATAQNGMEQ